ncbi:MAG: ATP-dependent sacrificial sulfur transferase LarE [Planctomycetota bacterium]
MESKHTGPGYAGRLARLQDLLRQADGLCVAVSGGVDSVVLLHAAHTALGERAVGVVADSPSLPRAELAAARRAAAAMGARLEVVATDELADPRYQRNAGDRCYFCKEALFDAMALVAERHGLVELSFGEIVDDAADDRPGARSAAERGVRAPLAEAGFGKDDVRRYAREHGLEVWDKPSSACLASRIPRGTAVTRERLARVEAAEAEVRALGFRVLRVRDHGEHARLELGADERERGERLRDELERKLGEFGFTELALATYVTPGERPAPRP